jgi:hypothetical protein
MESENEVIRFLPQRLLHQKSVDQSLQNREWNILFCIVDVRPISAILYRREIGGMIVSFSVPSTFGQFQDSIVTSRPFNDRNSPNVDDTENYQLLYHPEQDSEF